MNQSQQIQRERNYERLGTRSPICKNCGETHPVALTGVDPDIICYECRRMNDGKSSVEAHHIVGRHNDPATVKVDGNDHRILSDMQRIWPKETLRNPNGSLLLKIAATIRSIIDWFSMMVDRALGWIPDFLEKLDAWLREQIGPDWQAKMGLS